MKVIIEESLSDFIESKLQSAYNRGGKKDVTHLSPLAPRFRSKHSEEEYYVYRDKKIKNAIEGLNIYKALEQTFFKKGKQFQHIQDLADAITSRG